MNRRHKGLTDRVSEYRVHLKKLQEELRVKSQVSPKKKILRLVKSPRASPKKRLKRRIILKKNTSFGNLSSMIVNLEREQASLMHRMSAIERSSNFENEHDDLRHKVIRTESRLKEAKKMQDKMILNLLAER